MKQTIEPLLRQAILSLQNSGQLPADLNPIIKVDHVKDPAFGDYATNLALILAKSCGQAPRQLAQLLIEALPQDPSVKKVDVGGLGLLISSCKTMSFQKS